MEILSIPTLGDLGRAEAGLNQDISALGSKSGSNGLGQSVGTSQERSASLNTELELLSHLVSTMNSISNPNCFVLPCEQIELADQGCFQIGTCKRRTQPRRGHEKPMRAAFCLLISEIGEKKKKNKETGYHKPEPRRASLQRNSRLEEERIWKPLVVNWRAACTPPKKLSRSVGKTWILSRASAEISLAARPELFYPLPAESVDSGGGGLEPNWMIKLRLLLIFGRERVMSKETVIRKLELFAAMYLRLLRAALGALV